MSPPPGIPGQALGWGLCDALRSVTSRARDLLQPCLCLQRDGGSWDLAPLADSAPRHPLRGSTHPADPRCTPSQALPTTSGGQRCLIFQGRPKQGIWAYSWRAAEHPSCLDPSPLGFLTPFRVCPPSPSHPQDLAQQTPPTPMNPWSHKCILPSRGKGRPGLLFQLPPHCACPGCRLDPGEELEPV